MKLSKTTVVIGAALTLAACETTQMKSEMTADGQPLWAELGAPETPLEPMPLPELAKVGDTRIIMRKGEEQEVVVKAVSEDSITRQLSTGCQFTEIISNNNLPAMGPSINWENCQGGSAGHAKVSVSNELFPLEIGKKVVYSINGESTAGNWTGTWADRRVCIVSDQIRVQTPGGEYDTWKIICKDKNSKRVLYISPELGHAVVFKRKHYKDKGRTYSSVFLHNG